MKNFRFKNDKYKKNRGGASKLLLLSCTSCKQQLCFYQKDGPGPLKRLYFDRILDSDSVYTETATDLNNIPQLLCSNCECVLGIPIIYEKENRKAYRLFVGAISKKTMKNVDNLE